jgi:hypothetical protein
MYIVDSLQILEKIKSKLIKRKLQSAKTQILYESKKTRKKEKTNFGK